VKFLSNPNKLRFKSKRQEILTGYLFVLPDLAGLVIFVIIPILYAIFISFHEWDLISQKTFVGLRNYQELLSDNQWWAALLRTFQFTLIYVPVLLILSLLFAVFINLLKGKILSFVRTSFLMPFAITSVISATLWMFLYNEKQGFLNAILRAFGIPALAFLGDIHQAMVSVIAVVVWINLGYNMILFLSAIKEIPITYIEAAQLDGANPWQVFRHITMPSIKETGVFVLITSTIASFQILDQIMVMTRGGPSSATEVGVLYIYRQSFDFLKMGYGSALSVILFLILLLFSLLQFKLTSAKQ
jgi:ABC-type sugar transport systems, permease components